MLHKILALIKQERDRVNEENLSQKIFSSQEINQIILTKKNIFLEEPQIELVDKCPNNYTITGIDASRHIFQSREKTYSLIYLAKVTIIYDAQKNISIEQSPFLIECPDSFTADEYARKFHLKKELDCAYQKIIQEKLHITLLDGISEKYESSLEENPIASYIDGAKHKSFCDIPDIQLFKNFFDKPFSYLSPFICPFKGIPVIYLHLKDGNIGRIEFLRGINQYKKTLAAISREIKKSYEYPLILTYAHHFCTIDKSIKNYLQYSFSTRQKDLMKIFANNKKK